MKYVSRKFIDLIQGVTSKWANWDPPKAINVGDYGMVNNETGEFEWEGNLYTTTNTINIDMMDPALRPIEQGGGDDTYIMKTCGITTKEVNASGEATLPGMVNVALKVDFQFEGGKPAAALVMYKPRYISLPNDERIVQLLKSRPDILKGKYIVTEVIYCAAYVMYISDEKAEKFSAALQAIGPVAPAVNAGGAASFAWSSQKTCGIYRAGSDPTTKYMPLFRLKKPRSKFWWIPGQRSDDLKDFPINKWDDVDPPWDPLDDEGEEDVIYDAELHGDYGVFNDGYPDNGDDDW